MGTTVDPDTCACDVSKAEVTDLKTRLEKVEKLLAGSDIGSLESTVNDVLNGVTTMQQCISKMVLPGTEETKAPVETTKMDYPETTKYTYETTMKAVETTMKKYETTMMDTTKMATTMMKDTTMMETTALPIEPTEAYEMYGTLDTNPDHGNKCQMGAARAFKIGLPLLKDVSNVVTKILTASTQPLNCPNIALVAKLFLPITLQVGTLTKPTCAVVNSLTQKL